LCPDLFGVFAVNVNKLNFEEHYIKEMNFITEKNDVEFLEVEIDTWDENSVVLLVDDLFEE
jgi:hypothetical protein